MGLFRKSRRNDASAWARVVPVAPDPGENDARSKGKHDFNDSLASGKRDFNASLGTSQWTILTVTDDAASAAPSLDPADAARRIRSLERRLRQRDLAMARLRAAAEAGKRVRDKRIESLERQLERLAELPSGAGRALLDPGRKGSSPRARSDSGEERRSELEVTALQELLARVIGEKDRLTYENENLRSLVKQLDGHFCIDTMPSSIIELDGMMIVNEQKKNFLGKSQDSLLNTNNKHKSREKCSGHSRVDQMPPSIIELDQMMVINEQKENFREQGDPQDSLLSSNNKNKSREGTDEGPPTPPNDRPAVLYKMSCRDRPRDQSHLRYMGNYTPVNHANSVNEIKRMIKSHYSRVWRMVLEENGGLSLNSPGEELDGCGFPASSLARHCVEHCKRFSTEEEVVQWCTDNIKVEIQRKEKRGSRVPLREKEGRRTKKKNRPGRSGKEDKTKATSRCEI